MTHYNDLPRESKQLANRLYSVVVKIISKDDPGGHFAKCDGPPCDCHMIGSRLMQAMVDEVASIDRERDPEYQELLRLKKKFGEA